MNHTDAMAHELIIKVMKAMDRVVRTPEEIDEQPIEFLCPEVYRHIFNLATAAAIAVMEEVVAQTYRDDVVVSEDVKWS